MVKHHRTYHTFVRYHEATLPPRKIKAIMKAGTGIVTIRLREEHIREAMKRKGFADSQNCAAAICTVAHAKEFPFEMAGIVDWWRNRVILLSTEFTRKNQPVCYAYAHYDNTEELFDGTIAIFKTSKRFRRTGLLTSNTLSCQAWETFKDGEASRPAGATSSANTWTRS